MEHCETIDYNEYKIEIYYDDDPIDPRGWDNLGTMTCFHRNYNLGDAKPKFKDRDDLYEHLVGDQFYNALDASVNSDEHFQELNAKGLSVEKITEQLCKEFNDALWEEIHKKNFILPLRLYDHSGISISTSSSYPFNDIWDSMPVGYVWVSKEKALEEFGELNEEKILKHLESEVEEYDDFLTGNSYGYTLIYNPTGEEVASCWGYLGTAGKEFLIQEAKNSADYDIKERFPLLNL